MWMETTKNRMMWVTATFIWALLTGCAQTSAVKQDEGPGVVQTRSSLEPLGGFFELPFKVHASQSRIVIYQTAEEKLLGATSVFVDGSYHASVVGGAWTQLCYRPGNVDIGARQMQVGARPKDLMDSITALNLSPGQTYFLRVVQENSRPVFKPVPQSQAMREVSGTRQQMHTISRVAQECVMSAETVVKPAASSEPITLTANVLFEFDRSDATAMTPASLQSIDAHLLQWRNDKIVVERVHVIGHADPLGKPSKNASLSQERSRTVREHLQKKLPDGVPITFESRGASEPVVRDCAKAPTPKSIACNLSNRRVVVLITGTAR